MKINAKIQETVKKRAALIISVTEIGLSGTYLLKMLIALKVLQERYCQN
jgi:hypothetical protein